MCDWCACGMIGIEPPERFLCIFFNFPGCCRAHATGSPGLRVFRTIA
ncbi:hypothetical protein BSIN_3429 [Burkholderia singularis]|uniref:Uncharacterized protein n=1 Tax=Burkholderia singularis TaxID=1503053 RepID=A0A238H4X7_9BURK|nr:hypothetical protein BSIN_3429 [Burkholderia singularis]